MHDLENDNLFVFHTEEKSDSSHVLGDESRALHIEVPKEKAFGDVARDWHFCSSSSMNDKARSGLFFAM